MARYTIGLERLGIELDKITSTGYTTCFKCSEHRKTYQKQKQKVLKVYVDTGFYKCHHCGTEGRVDSNEWINNQELNDIEKNYTPPTKPTMKPFVFDKLNDKAIQYLALRGISLETAKACKLAQKGDLIAFNYYKGDTVTGAKYRSINDKKFFQHPNCKKYLYGINDIENTDTMVIVEGEFDKLAFYEAGIKNVVSVSQGAPNEGQEIGTKLQCLDNSIDYIKDKKRVILACDNDPNGRYLTKVLIERFGANRCAVIEFPEGYKDANDILLNLGAEKLRQLVEEAKDTPIAGVRTLQQASSKMWDIYDNGYRKGVPTNIKELNGVFSFYKMWWGLWHGIPNSGKSAFVHFLMMCMSVHHGWKWAVFSPEHYPEEDFYIDMVEILTGRNVEPSKPNRLSEEEFQAAMTFIDEHFYFVYPQVDHLKNTSENVLDKIRELKLSKDIDGFLIDPYNQLLRESGENIDVYLERSLSEIDVLCNTHNLNGNIVAHPRTLYKEKDQEDYKKPSPYQIAGGAMWYNKAYTIGNVHRPFNQSDKKNRMVEIDIQKVKSHKRVGTPACETLFYDIYTGWYCSDDGTCALDGAFDRILQQYGVIQGTGAELELDFEGDPLPF
jgi:twinkle protein